MAPNSDNFKGTVSRDFSPPIFFINLFLLVLKDMHRSDFNFFKIIVDTGDKFLTGVNDTGK
jgi:hypothetical protein